MTALRFVVPLILSTVACSPAWSDSGTRFGQPARPDSLLPSPVAVDDQKHTAKSMNISVIRVGASDPDTQLILPWFLTDIVNAMNARTSTGDFLRTVGDGF